MDTTTVNFAINKMSEGWAKVAPTIQDIGEKYVQYVVTQQILLVFVWTFIFLISIGLLLISRFLFKQGNQNDPSFSTIILFIFGVVGCLFGTFGVLNKGYNATLAYLNPEMYTIQTIIDAAKRP